MNRTVRKLTAIAVLGSVLEPAFAMACVADAGVETPPSRSSILSNSAAEQGGTRKPGLERLLLGPEPLASAAHSAPSPHILPITISSLLAHREAQQSEAELRRLGEQESEYGRRKAAAIAKKGTGTLIGLGSVAAALGLAALGWDKNKEEDKSKVPDNERESGYYLLGAIVVGAGGGSWGFGLRRRGQAELRDLESQKISFGTDRHGSPVLLYSAHF